MHQRVEIPGLAVLLVLVLASCTDAPTAPPDAVGPTPPSAARGGNGKGGGNELPDGGGVVALGRALFGDEALSLNGNQSCQTCHEPSQGFAAPLRSVTTEGSVVEGSQPGMFGDRKPPTVAYASLAPSFTPSGNGATGGIFWDGRATGEVLGSPVADQALGPFLNPAEQALPDAACVIWKVQASRADEWLDVWETDISAIGWPADVATVCGTWVSAPGALVSLSPGDRALVETAYHQVALSIAAFEDSRNAFASRFDAGVLDEEELWGQKLFSSKAKCQQCHENKGSRPLFTDHAFHNLGVPHNPDHPVYPDAASGFDPGLGGTTGSASHEGRFRTPTLRNVSIGDNRTYMHNGALTSLRQVVQFYNTRDVLPTCDPVPPDPAVWGPDGVGCWPAPEHAANLDTRNMGNLGLTDAEVNALVAFLEALGDAGL